MVYFPLYQRHEYIFHHRLGRLHLRCREPGRSQDLGEVGLIHLILHQRPQLITSRLARKTPGTEFNKSNTGKS